MKRFDSRSYLIFAGVWWFVIAGLSVNFGATAAEPGSDRPNIVLILADDLGFSDVGCYGGEIGTPNIDRLAEEGMKFSQFYNCAVCRTTRVSLITGLHPRRRNGRLLHDDMTTLGEVAQSAGYRTSLIGKWHFPVKKETDRNRLPTRRGFDKYYGLAAGCCNFFNPALPNPDFYRGQDPYPFLDQEKEITEFPPDYYTTDAFTDRAVEQISGWSKAENPKPFFLHLCYTAPHYPLHAKPDDIAEFKGRYDKGYSALREERLKRLRKLGIIDPKWKLSPPDPDTSDFIYDYGVVPWEEVENLEREKRRMEVYAAMVRSMDRGIGRVMEALEKGGIAENTVVIFLSDNGGCASHSGYQREDVRKAHEAYNQELPGSVDTYDYVAQGWGWAQNTPFRRYKVWTYEGGISTPMIVRWPGKVEAGTMTKQVGHVVDFMPTILELTGARYPENRKDLPVTPTEGLSLAPVLKGGSRPGHDSLCWYLYGNRAVRQGKWKLVWGSNRKTWELYDMENDRTETEDLSKQFPDKVLELEAVWMKWAKETGTPLKGNAI